MSFFFFKQKTAYEMRISDWSSDVCSSDLQFDQRHRRRIEVLRAVFFNRPGDIFAQLHTELIEGVDTHQHRVDERALFVKCDQRTQYFRRYIVERSEEHTSELQSLMRISYAVFCLKKKT